MEKLVVHLTVAQLRQVIKEEVDRAIDQIQKRDYPTLMTAAQAASYLNISKSSLYKYVREGRILRIKNGRYVRFPKQGLDKFSL